jgi:hypothetical protein
MAAQLLARLLREGMQADHSRSDSNEVLTILGVTEQAQRADKSRWARSIGPYGFPEYCVKAITQSPDVIEYVPW